MKLYEGKIEDVPMFGRSLDRLQIIWFALIEFLLFLMEQAEEEGWIREYPEQFKGYPLGIPEGVWPMPEPHPMPQIGLEEVILRLCGPGPEGYGDRTIQPGQIAYILRNARCWNEAVAAKNQGEARAIAQIAPDLLRYNWNLVNSAAVELRRLKGEAYYSPLKWREEVGDEPIPVAAEAGKTPPKKTGNPVKKSAKSKKGK
jgi:hypothetical protein